MREMTGVNLWDFHERGEWCCITTNGVLRKDGTLIMGNEKPGTGGIAGDAARRYKDLPRVWGWTVKHFGNIPAPHWETKLLSFPTKHDWRDPSDMVLIQESAEHLMTFLNMNDSIKQIFLPRPGCGKGGLSWADVKARIAPILDDRVIVVTN